MMDEATLVRELLSYDPTTGEFRFKQSDARSARWNTRWAGKVAGGPHSSGYWSVGFNGKKHLAHRLAWLYVHGHWPSNYIDHRNLNKRDNRLQNLREADCSQNSANISTRKNSNSGFRGVYFLKTRQKWVASINKDGKRYFLGHFTSPEKASLAYAAAAEKFYGEFCPEHLKQVA